MGYSQRQIEHFSREQRSIVERLEWLTLEFVRAAESVDSKKAKEHLTHGAGRRTAVIRRALQNVFTAFPLDATRPLTKSALTDTQINLHAFLANLYGVFDNCAWGFVYRHNLTRFIADRRMVGMFNSALIRHLPEPLGDYVEKTRDWFNDYLKDYRDALAHRIPLYIPPAEFSPQDGERFKALEEEKIECLRRRAFERINEINNEQNSMGRPSFMFLHSYSDDDNSSRPLIIHPQMLSDALTLLDFSEVFIAHWDGCRT